MMNAFQLWLEFEHWIPSPDDDPDGDFANIAVTLSDGRRYALTVWTFRFLERARRAWPDTDASGPAAEYVVAPDLFVERLSRDVIDRAVCEMLAKGEMRDEWLCVEGDDAD